MSQAPSLRLDRLSWVVSLAPPIWHFAEIFSENDFSQFGELGRKYTANVEIAADPSVPEICQPAAAFVDRSPPLWTYHQASGPRLWIYHQASGPRLWTYHQASGLRLWTYHQSASSGAFLYIYDQAVAFVDDWLRLCLCQRPKMRRPASKVFLLGYRKVCWIHCSNVWRAIALAQVQPLRALWISSVAQVLQAQFSDDFRWRLCKDDVYAVQSLLWASSRV